VAVWQATLDAGARIETVQHDTIKGEAG